MTAEGLTQAEAATRLKAEGHNELPATQRRSIVKIILGVLREPMFLMLLSAAAIYFVVGDFREALFIGIFASLSVVITIVQEARSEKVLESLRDLTSPRALVIRDGQPQRVPGRDVVRGDLVILAEGDRVPADARLLDGDSIAADESLLTGESVPVPKSGAAPETSTVYAGTLVTSGSGKALVTATGVKSEIGKIGQSLYDIEMEEPRLKAQTQKIVRVFAAIGMSVSVLFVLVDGFARGRWAEAMLGGIALGMSMLPEEFPLVLTVFMVMGAWRISRVNVLTRRAAAIETLGSATVLCTDKTGTLTQNRMTVTYLQGGAEEWRLQDGGAAPAGIPAALLALGARASKGQSYDPVDMAFTAGTPQENAFRHYGVSPEWPVMVNAHAADGRYDIAAKGAPEAILRLCRADAETAEKVLRRIDVLAAQGMRVLALARGRLHGPDLPQQVQDFTLEFAGLAGLADPLRPEVRAAVEECRTAGIRVIMMTGDYPATAAAIAAQAGIATARVLDGRTLRGMTDDDLRRELKNVSVFARITPDQKLRLVEMLKALGEVVAMTGDGVNDAPSLKAAHIGIAMGGRGTDVAREAASIVLLDDNFGSLVRTVRLGRRIHDNLKKAILFILAVHVPIAGFTLLPVMFGMPLILTPLLIALLEMIIDPTCSLVLEAEGEEEDVMKRPPHDPHASIMTRPLLVWGLLQGVLALVMVGTVTFVAAHEGLPENEIRSLSFVLLLMCNIAIILANRSFSTSIITAFRRRNPLLGWGSAFMVLLFTVLLRWPPLSSLFRFGPLHDHDLAISAGGGLLLLLILEAIKPLMAKTLRA